MHCSYIEIYNEQIYDLLKAPQKLSETLSINEDGKKEFYIKGVIEESVSSLEEALGILHKGEQNRHYAQTQMNHHSSRSHAIFRIVVKSITNKFIKNYRRFVFENEYILQRNFLGKKKVSNVNNEELLSELFKEENW